MKKLPFSCISLFIFAIFFIIACSSCSRQEKNPENVRQKPDRAITIINNTGNQITAYEVKVANGPSIQIGIPPSNSFSYIIPDAYTGDRQIEVVLKDRSERFYAKTFTVPLEGNTDTTITAGDRVPEGFVTDTRKDIEAWLNRNK